MTVEQRLLAHMEVADETGCWLWTAFLTPNGYGLMRVDPKQSMRFAHRVAYELFVGPIPEGLVLDHLCRNRACFNPEHLEPVTLRENILRGVGMGAEYAKRTHCKYGHEYTPENTRMRATPHGETRLCRACRRHNRAQERLQKRLRKVAA